jgi:regulator of ribonuclease activity A
MKTADLCDSFISSPSRMSVCESGCLLDYGGLKSFYGMIQTVRCFESNTIVRETLSTKGNGRVLVVDGGGSKRCALLGDILAKMAHENGWSGIVINGCIRDSAIIAQLPIGIKALGVHPLKSIKRTDGEVGCPVAFAGVEFAPTYWLYADEVRFRHRLIF